MPDHPLLSKDDLMMVLWERSDDSVEQVRDRLLALEILAKRARCELGFLMHQHHVDPEHIPAAKVLLDELDDALSKPNTQPLRWLKMTQPKGQLLGFRKR